MVSQSMKLPFFRIVLRYIVLFFQKILPSLYEANVYCFEEFTPNNLIIKPSNKKINFKKKSQSSFFGAK